MVSKLLNSKIIFSVLMAGAMVVEPFAVYADANINGADDAAFTCSSAINVMDCINQTQGPSVQQQSAGNLKTAIPVSNQTFGLTGPVSFNVRYDQDLSCILDAGLRPEFRQPRRCRPESQRRSERTARQRHHRFRALSQTAD